MKYFVSDQNICVDKSTVASKGRISFITYSPKKQTKWGLRVYVLSDSKSSYIYSFIPYYGKITTDELIHPELQFTSKIVLQLYENLLENILVAKGYHIFTNRFYTSPALAIVQKKKCYFTGTIMSNRKRLKG